MNTNLLTVGFLIVAAMSTNTLAGQDKNVANGQIADLGEVQARRIDLAPRP